jgi:hypothetical protein
MGDTMERVKAQAQVVDGRVKEFGAMAKMVRVTNKLSRKKVEPVFEAYTEQYGDDQQDIKRFVVAVEHAEFSKVRFYWPEMVAEATGATSAQTYLLYATAGMMPAREKELIEHYYLIEWMCKQGGLMDGLKQRQFGDQKITDMPDIDKLVLFFTVCDTLKDALRIFDE